MRTPSKSNPYWLSKHNFLMVVHFCLQYPEWQREKEEILLDAQASGIRYTDMPKGTAFDPDPTMEAGGRLAELSRRIDIINKTAYEISPQLARWLIKGVTENLSYESLRSAHGLPCGDKQYRKIRQRFYYEVSKKL
ncbi:MAG: hypothetical protein IJJ38_00990 [Lachnospiraceae bacterium]|nr:hypothetical protein [Lachnospiraceae bacterium]